MKQTFFTNYPLVISLILTLSIATTEIPLWASAFSFLFVLWKFLHEKFNVYKLSPKITPVFGLMFFIVVYIQHRTIFGQEESITILVGLTAITILNFETERDLLFLVLLGFMMVVLKSVFSIDFIWVLPALVSFFGLWITLISNPNVNKYKYVLSTTLRAFPILVILFLLFPRFVLFQVNKNMQKIAQSGFNEELTPGRFTNVALSDEMVFRAQFLNTDKINGENLYWRGSVLSNSNGFVWTKELAPKRSSSPTPSRGKSTIKYRVILEPLNFKNIFVLDSPVRVKTSENLLDWSQAYYTLAVPQQQLVQYDGEAKFDNTLENEDDPIGAKKYLKISELPPKTKDWVEATKNKHKTLNERLKALISFFEKPGFIYTLNADYYGNDMDEFLFSKKKGFCEHYAASFATMARGLEIPSRVVIGYQGGSYNALSEFWKISQKDAHAWVEVGLGNSWLRIDPTGLVTPLRIALGSEDYFALSEADRILFSKDKEWKDSSEFRRFYNAARSLLDSLNYNWTMFLLNYDLQAQLDLLKSIKIGWLVLFLIAAVGVVLIFIAYKSRKKEKAAKHKLYFLFTQVEKWAKHHQVEIEPATTPLQLLGNLQLRYPSAKSFVEDFSAEYQRLVYQEKDMNKSVVVLKKQWKNFTDSEKRAS